MGKCDQVLSRMQALASWLRYSLPEFFQSGLKLKQGEESGGEFGRALDFGDHAIVSERNFANVG